MGVFWALNAIVVRRGILKENHVFVKSAKAQVVWNYFVVKMGIACRSNVLKLRLNEWWFHRFRSPCFKALMTLFPTRISWDCGEREIWGGLKILS